MTRKKGADLADDPHWSTGVTKRAINALSGLRLATRAAGVNRITEDTP